MSDEKKTEENVEVEDLEAEGEDVKGGMVVATSKVARKVATKGNQLVSKPPVSGSATSMGPGLSDDPVVVPVPRRPGER